MASSVPEPPATPWYVSSTSTTITIGWNNSADNGGSPVTLFNVYVASGVSGDTFSLIGSTEDLEFTLDNTVHTQFITGQIYKFQVTAINSIGESQPSLDVDVLLKPLPSAPAAPTIDLSRSTLTSAYVQWTSPGTDTTGYRLYMSLQGEGIFRLIYDGSTNNEVTYANVTGLITGESYSFYVEALNFNGVGTPSAETFAYICLAPWGFAVPLYVSSTKTSITIAWKPPLLDGGCPIYTYQLYVNDVLTDDAVITKRPYLQTYTISGLTLVGQSYSIKLTALNYNGQVTTDTLSVILAAVPDTPSVVPYQDFTQTTGT